MVRNAVVPGLHSKKSLQDFVLTNQTASRFPVSLGALWSSYC